MYCTSHSGPGLSIQRKEAHIIYGAAMLQSTDYDATLEDCRFGVSRLYVLAVGGMILYAVKHA